MDPTHAFVHKPHPLSLAIFMHSGPQDMWTLGLLGALGCFDTDLD